MIDYSEQLFNSIDLIVKQRIESINYDSTIIATIEDSSQNKQNKYICSQGSTSFIAYSTNTGYKNGESVYVTVPNNDWDAQKIIVGRYVAKNEKPFAFVQPFDTMINLSSNLISSSTIGKVGLRANDDCLVEEDGQIVKEEKRHQILLWEKSYDGKDNGNGGYNDSPLSGYTRLGLQGQFASYTKSLEIAEGDYGYRLEISVSNGDTINSENQKQDAKIIEMFLSNKEMYGDPFNYQSFVEQEAVFDISDIGDITGIKLYFYQTPGSFKDINNKDVPFKDAVFDTLMLQNLFTQEPYICLGYDLGSFEEEQAILFSNDGLTYKNYSETENVKNYKLLEIRWLHEYPSGIIKVVNKDSDIMKDVEIRWYRYELGAPSPDEYSGVYWKRIDKNINENPFTLRVEDLRYNLQTEQFKAIIFYNGKIVRTNTLVFTNEQEVANQATVQLLAGLSLHCEDNSFGNYFEYGQDNKLINSTKSNEILSLKAYFATLEEISKGTTTELTEFSKITWYFPKNNTMLKLHGYEGSESAKSSYYENREVTIEDDYYKITTIGTPENNYVEYRIVGFYDPTKINNTVRCTVEKGGFVYSAIKEFSFGFAGTNGTDTTLVLDFDGNITALTAGLEKGETVSVTAHLYDSNRKEINFGDLSSVEIEWEWLKGSYGTEDIELKFESNSNQCFIKHKILNMNNPPLLVLQATVKKYGDYDLVAYKPIPVRANYNLAYAVTPTEVIYNTFGGIEYYRQPCEIYTRESYSVVNIDGDEKEYPLVNDYTQSTIQLEKEDRNWEIYNPNEEEQEFIGSIKDNILSPLSMYIQDALPYGIKINEEWIQPLAIIQNRYPVGVVNNWSGKEVKIGDDHILSQMIAAGKKDGENSFSGVMMGDLTVGDSSIVQTGLYGFHNGASSFGFKEDGTAFIGKSGSGRILFDGNQGIIESKSYDTLSYGMKLDIKDGILTLKGPNGGISMSAENASYPLIVGSKFKVQWDGTIEALNGKFEGEISGSAISGSTISGGTISGSTIKAGTLSSNNSTDRIALEGYLSVGGGALGEVYSDISWYNENGQSIGNSSKPGIGLVYGKAEIKATAENVGFRFDSSNYITVLKSGEIAVGGAGFHINGIPANKQKGIYARFA